MNISLSVLDNQQHDQSCMPHLERATTLDQGLDQCQSHEDSFEPPIENDSLALESVSRMEEDRNSDHESQDGNGEEDDDVHHMNFFHGQSAGSDTEDEDIDEDMDEGLLV